MAGKVWEKVLHAFKIATWISTMPWVCLQAPIEQILREQDLIQQKKQLDEWQVRKNSELQMVSLAVSHLIAIPPATTSLNQMVTESLLQGTLIASAVTGSIQWSSLSAAHWIVAAA